MSTNTQYRQRDDRPVDDQIVYPHDVSWEDDERLLAMRADYSAPRISPSSTIRANLWRKQLF